MFGVYQPLIGWKSGRKLSRIKEGVREESLDLLTRLARNLESVAPIEINADCYITAPELVPAGLAGPSLTAHESIVLNGVRAELERSGEVPRDIGSWRAFVGDDVLTSVLR